MQLEAIGTVSGCRTFALLKSNMKPAEKTTLWHDMYISIQCGAEVE